ncbi:MAG TPA: VOC family protein [Rhizomicrobium sp.]|jgi:catechol 2,3-dioxygenase-like lactoylglutathione lyase family enzyme
MDKTMTPQEEPFQFRGVNHIALVCKDMAETVDFYTRVLEMKLVKTLDLPNGRGQHFFFDCGNGDCIAFFWFPNAPKVAPGIASMHEDYAKLGTQTAHASMNHLAIDIPLEKFDAYAERLRSKGVAITVMNHEDSDRHSSADVGDKTWIRSIYFRDPNGIHLEFASLTRAFSAGDVRHDPVNEKGERVPLRQETLEYAD